MGTKTWGKLGNPSWVGPARQIDRPAPLGRNQPDRHREADEPVSRDDAPITDAYPEFLAGDRQAWLSAGGAAPAEHDPGPHSLDGPHTLVTSTLDRDPADELDFRHRDTGGHRPAELKGAGGAAHGGLRGDSAASWANPEGFRLGTDYDPVNMQRPMPHGRMRPALRGVGEPYQAATGAGSSPPPARGRNTSPFDPAAPRRGFGPEPTTARHIARPLGDEPREAVNYGTIGDGFMR